ncbi:hypothetical protein MAPG_05948 [Magnaporthiopsis poae ATCC 64411]|uniref:Uncharacterized protein n=1 Tax=Magnaporthiopsis poae (strain ATCC 64411 / 73-15) TaxID=644358 RepID=A0A0C4E0R5_MAGP6|nr:hypothetical protein MAPG_05948 [Magnaporthiopsis poae ATCC 64411]
MLQFHVSPQLPGGFGSDALESRQDPEQRCPTLPRICTCTMHTTPPATLQLFADTGSSDGTRAMMLIRPQETQGDGMIRSTAAAEPRASRRLPTTTTNIKMCGDNCTCGTSCSCANCGTHPKYVGLGVPWHDPLGLFFVLTCWDILGNHVLEFNLWPRKICINTATRLELAAATIKRMHEPVAAQESWGSCRDGAVERE